MFRNIEEVLADLGVSDNTLNSQEKQHLDAKGYLLLYNVMNESWLLELREKYEELMAKEGKSAGTEVHQEPGTRRLSDLVNKGECFDLIYTHPKVLAAVHHVIRRDFKLSSLNARDALPGEGMQGLHADWGAREAGEPFHVCNSIWLIDDFTPDNGATRVVPGSHLLAGKVADYMDNPKSSHPDEVKIIAPAGTVGVFNSHTWHGGTLNRSDHTRRAMHGYFTAREFGQQLDQAEYIRMKTYNRISAAAKYILDV